MAIFAIMPAMFFLPAPGEFMDCHARVVLHISDDLAPQIDEIRYWPFEWIPNGSDPDELREKAYAAERSGSDYICEIFYAYSETGWLVKHRVETRPLAKHLVVWFHLKDGSWTTQTLQTPSRDSKGIREVMISNF
jgi:hypothetical protein